MMLHSTRIWVCELITNILNFVIMKPAKEIIPHLVVVIAGLVAMGACFWYVSKHDQVFTELTGIIRVTVALAASAISISLPGFVSLETEKNTSDSLWPKIKAGGALAIFILVYLFDPINGGGAAA